jgi:Putative restriction endonuclease
LPASPWHDHGAERLKEILKAAAAQAGADLYVAGGPNDVSTPAGIRKPDVFVVPKDVARSAIGRRVRTYYASDLLLVAEVVSPAQRQRTGRPAFRRIARWPPHVTATRRTITQSSH